MMKIKRTLAGILVMMLLIGTGFAPITEVQASAKVGTVIAKVRNTTVGADLKVTWEKVSKASGYEVYLSTSKKGTYKKVETTTSTFYTTSKLKKNKTYYFKVRAYTTVDDASSYGSYSKIVSGKTSKYPLYQVIDKGGQEVYFYWLWDGKTAHRTSDFWNTWSKCEKILRERYSILTKKKLVGSSKKPGSTNYSINGKIVSISTPHLELGPGGGDSGSDEE